VTIIFQVRRAAFARALRAIAVSAKHMPQSEQAICQRLTQRWRSIGILALVAGAFLLPAFAAQAQIATVTTLTSSENPSHVSDPVTFTATVTSNGNGAPTGSVLFFDFKTDNSVSVPLTPGSGDTSTATVTFATIDPGTLQTGIHGMEAIYQPSGNFGSSVGSLLQQVNPDGTTGTTTTLVSSQNPSETGQSVTFTATVTAVSGSTAPTGTVSFFDSVAGLLSTVNLGPGSGVTSQATLTTSALTGSATGTQHNLNAVYNPTGSFATSTSVNLVQTVSNGIPTTVTVSGSPNPSTVNQAVTLTATVAAAAGFTGTPTGTVDLSVIINGTNHVVGSGVTLSNGTASATAPGTLFPTAGTFIVQAIYHATRNFQDQTVGQSSQIVTSGTATTAMLTSSPNPSFVNGAVSFTATIKAASGTPTGNVNFVDNSNGGNSLGVVTLSAATGGAAATLSNITSLAGGTHNIEAIYAGDGTFAASTASVTQTVNTPTATTTTVMSSANPSLVGQTVTFTATVSPNTATGSVIFTIDGTAGAPIKLSGGAATTSTSALTVAGSPHSVSAAYTSTDGSFGASTGTLNPGQTVNKNTSSTVVTSGQNPTATGNTVTFTATVSGNGGGAVTPGGTVQFSDNGTNVGAPVTLVNGVATLPILLSTGGTHTIKGTYNGDTNFNGSNGSFSETVNAGTATTTTIASSQNPSVFGQPVTFTATVTGSGGTPTGSVTFTIDGIAGFTVNLVNGVATTPPQTGLNVPGSPHTITAAYSGDATLPAAPPRISVKTSKRPTRPRRLLRRQIRAHRASR
jgi:large repetitive protein